ncbi:hypothetical protein PGT21_007141 [Puccinia graminis f. sp. tritici]|uniref:F-box domain-containing protein n=1 Tax=Puccinia graminis f. sp. tritici TaxID=56615 RepID=A0A5B0NWW3_PUCGR|nr:hypothetical protein PGT21_007141 [Puccinia graminis f. sp. tritici]KAA1093655.1 hypothetical protein PGTUg99_017021 [Puccinia graminis f. sp. tritici]
MAASPSLANDNKSNVQRTKTSLSHLPYEVKQCIVYWVDLFQKEPSRFGSDSHLDQIAGGINHPGKTESRNNHPLLAPPSAQLTNLLNMHRFFHTASTTNNDNKPSIRPQCNSILALCLVDRMFYDICRPLIWQTLDLKEFHLSKLRSLRTGGLTRNAEYVRKMSWRISVHELEALWPDLREELGANDEARKVQDWDESSRSTEILAILEMCTKVTSLDLDLRPTELDKQTGEFTIDETETTSKFFYPISRLTQLTSIALTTPLLANNSFTEQFLVRLIRDMSELQSFKCYGTDSVTPDLEGFSWPLPCGSPLGLHLSKLTSLKELYLQQSDCFDFTWSKIEWAGNLEKLTFDGCTRNPLRTLHAFCQKFSTSLRYLKLDYLEYEKDVYTTLLEPTRDGPLSEIKSGQYRLDLPELTTLSITTELPIDLLLNFRDCKNIKSIELAMNPSISAEQIRELPCFWPKLEKLKITINTKSDLARCQITALKMTYWGKGIELEIEDEDEEYNSARFGHAYEDDGYDSYDSYHDDDSD